MVDSKKNILLIPGTLCNEILWCEQIEALSRYANVTVTENAGSADITQLAKSILAKAPGSFSVAGLSLGGFIVFELFRQAPERIDRAVLLNTNAGAADPEFEIPLCEKLIKRAETEDIENIAQEFVPHFLTEYAQTKPDLCDKVIRMARQVGTQAYIKQTRASLGRPDSRLDITEIRSPVLIIGARQDVLTPPYQQEELAALIPIAQLEILEQCGHLSTLEKPHEISRLMNEWVNSNFPEPESNELSASELT